MSGKKGILGAVGRSVGVKYAMMGDTGRENENAKRLNDVERYRKSSA